MPSVAPDVNRHCGATLDSRKLKNPAFLLGYESYWIPLDLKLVEAGGIEPPSESCQRKASTCLVRAFDLVWATPANRISPEPVSQSPRTPETLGTKLVR